MNQPRNLAEYQDDSNWEEYQTAIATACQAANDDTDAFTCVYSV